MTAFETVTDKIKLACEPKRFAIVAIPANNEEERIAACLAALAVQRDRLGAPLAVGSFEILVFANNCTDATADVVGSVANNSPHPISLVSETLAPDRANAGWARKRAMDLAADLLASRNRQDGLILTTDADSCVAPTWIADTFTAFSQGADCVAGYIDAHPIEITKLGPLFMHRARLEDQYLRAVAEIYAVCDPRPHDPWPNHRVSSGASLAVALDAYLSIGGLPVRAIGEDVALTHALECAGFKIRHAIDVCVSTSCRFEGRAKGGAADTMRYRHSVADAPCDEDLEPAFFVVRRALYKGRLRRLSERGLCDWAGWSSNLGLKRATAEALFLSYDPVAFEEFWTGVAAASPVLKRRIALRPADLPRQIERAQMALRFLRGEHFVDRLNDRRADACLAKDSRLSLASLKRSMACGAG